MRKKALFYFIFIFNVIICAQSPEEKKYLLTNYANSIGISTLNINDPYLSPLKYSGIGIRYNFENSRFLSLDNLNVSKQNKLSVLGGMTLNPAFTSSMSYVGVNYSWGMHYHFRPEKELLLMAGGNCEYDFAVKNVPRNINNPINLDMATNLNLSGVLLYDVPYKTRIIQFQIAVQSPLLGVMFVPKAGASYYEMFKLWNLNDAVHFSSLHNKRGIDINMMFKVPFNYTNWRFGVGYKALKYSANEMVFKRNELSLLIGTTFDFISFAGRKNPAPRNFIRIDE
jgi:hypothetical protein